MEIIEFLQTTEQKNIKSYIGMKVLGRNQYFNLIFIIIFHFYRLKKKCRNMKSPYKNGNKCK